MIANIAADLGVPERDVSISQDHGEARFYRPRGGHRRRGRGADHMARAGTPQEPRLTRPARVFFALWPDDGVRDALHREAQVCAPELRRRVMRRENVHLTLVFVGDVAAERLDELGSVAGAIAGHSFELVLDQLGYWRHNTSCGGTEKRTRAVA